MPVFWFFIMLVGIGLFVLRVREPDTPRPFKVPLYPVTPVIFVATCAYLLYSSLAYVRTGALVGIGVLVIGGVLLALNLRHRRARPEEDVMGRNACSSPSPPLPSPCPPAPSRRRRSRRALARRALRPDAAGGRRGDAADGGREAGRRRLRPRLRRRADRRHRRAEVRRARGRRRHRPKRIAEANENAAGPASRSR